MTAVLEYHLGDIDEVAAKLADIRSGKSYIDLANDLSRLRMMYQAYMDIIRTDSRHFNPGQVKEAGRIADAIRATLAQPSNTEAEHWRDMQARAFELLRDTYDSIRAAATFLFGGDSAFVARSHSPAGFFCHMSCNPTTQQRSAGSLAPGCGAVPACCGPPH